MDLQESELEGVSEFIADIDGTQVDLGQASVTILKADIKERKGEFTLIFRYQLVQ